MALALQLHGRASTRIALDVTTAKGGEMGRALCVGGVRRGEGVGMQARIGSMR